MCSVTSSLRIGQNCRAVCKKHGGHRDIVNNESMELA